MRQEIDGLIRRDASLLSLVEQARKQLDEESEGTALPTQAKWYIGELVDDKPADPPAVWVTITDELGSTSRRIPVADLAIPSHRRHAIIRLWGDVLADRSERLMRRRLAAAGAGE